MASTPHKSTPAECASTPEVALPPQTTSHESFNSVESLGEVLGPEITLDDVLAQDLDVGALTSAADDELSAIYASGKQSRLSLGPKLAEVAQEVETSFEVEESSQRSLSQSEHDESDGWEGLLGSRRDSLSMPSLTRRDSFSLLSNRHLRSHGSGSDSMASLLSQPQSRRQSLQMEMTQSDIGHILAAEHDEKHLETSSVPSSGSCDSEHTIHLPNGFAPSRRASLAMDMTCTDYGEIMKDEITAVHTGASSALAKSRRNSLMDMTVTDLGEILERGEAVAEVNEDDDEEAAQRTIRMELTRTDLGMLLDSQRADTINIRSTITFKNCRQSLAMEETVSNFGSILASEAVDSLSHTPSDNDLPLDASQSTNANVNAELDLTMSVFETAEDIAAKPKSTLMERLHSMKQQYHQHKNQEVETDQALEQQKEVEVKKLRRQSMAMDMTHTNLGEIILESERSDVEDGNVEKASSDATNLDGKEKDIAVVPEEEVELEVLTPIEISMEIECGGDIGAGEDQVQEEKVGGAQVVSDCTFTTPLVAKEEDVAMNHHQQQQQGQEQQQQQQEEEMDMEMTQNLTQNIHDREPFPEHPSSLARIALANCDDEQEKQQDTTTSSNVQQPLQQPALSFLPHQSMAPSSSSLSSIVPTMTVENPDDILFSDVVSITSSFPNLSMSLTSREALRSAIDAASSSHHHHHHHNQQQHQQLPPEANKEANHDVAIDGLVQLEFASHASVSSLPHDRQHQNQDEEELHMDQLQTTVFRSVKTPRASMSGRLSFLDVVHETDDDTPEHLVHQTSLPSNVVSDGVREKYDEEGEEVGEVGSDQVANEEEKELPSFDMSLTQMNNFLAEETKCLVRKKPRTMQDVDDQQNGAASQAFALLKSLAPGSPQLNLSLSGFNNSQHQHHQSDPNNSNAMDFAEESGGSVAPLLVAIQQAIPEVVPRQVTSVSRYRALTNSAASSSSSSASNANWTSSSLRGEVMEVDGASSSSSSSPAIDDSTSTTKGSAAAAAAAIAAMQNDGERMDDEDDTMTATGTSSCSSDETSARLNLAQKQFESHMEAQLRNVGVRKSLLAQSTMTPFASRRNSLAMMGALTPGCLADAASPSSSSALAVGTASLTATMVSMSSATGGGAFTSTTLNFSNLISTSLVRFLNNFGVNFLDGMASRRQSIGGTRVPEPRSEYDRMMTVLRSEPEMELMKGAQTALTALLGECEERLAQMEHDCKAQCADKVGVYNFFSHCLTAPSASHHNHLGSTSHQQQLTLDVRKDLVQLKHLSLSQAKIILNEHHIGLYFEDQLHKALQVALSTTRNHLAQLQDRQAATIRTKLSFAKTASRPVVVNKSDSQSVICASSKPPVPTIVTKEMVKERQSHLERCMDAEALVQSLHGWCLKASTANASVFDFREAVEMVIELDHQQGGAARRVGEIRLACVMCVKSADQNEERQLMEKMIYAIDVGQWRGNVNVLEAVNDVSTQVGRILDFVMEMRLLARSWYIESIESIPSVGVSIAIRFSNAQTGKRFVTKFTIGARYPFLAELPVALNAAFCDISPSTVNDIVEEEMDRNTYKLMTRICRRLDRLCVM